jgi:CelD/BcsL family acetyltransferase involved in cellulose biosynthesis
MTAEVLRSLDEFAMLEPRWAVLAKAGGVRTPYQSYAWLDQWLRHRGNGMEPFVLVLKSGETIAPFGRVTRAGVRMLCLIGTPDSDYAGLVTTQSLDEAWNGVGRALAEARREFDLLHLHSVREREPIVAALERWLGGGGQERPYELCPWIPTDQSWEKLLASRGSELRNELKRWKRRLEELGELTVERVRPPLNEASLEELVDVERASWKWEHGNSSFSPGSTCNLLGSVLRDRRTEATVWLVRISGRLVAYALVLGMRDHWYYYLTTFRKETANAGSFLLGRIVEAACIDGCKALNLLRGNHRYKRAWTELNDTVHEVVWPVNIRGRAASLAFIARWHAARSPRLSRIRAHLFGLGDRR